MNPKTSKDDACHLFIKHNLTSKAKRRFIFFKPKDIIVSEPYEINLLITNKGNKTFPGGNTKGFKITHPYKADVTLDDISIPKIPRGETRITETIKRVATGSGISWFYLKIEPTDSKQIKYYQYDRGIKKEQLLPTPHWQDYFYVASQAEIHQRFTNYLLLILTIVMIILIGIPLLSSLFHF